MKATALHEGSYSVDVSKKFLPFDPAVHHSKDRPASLFIYVQPFIVQTKNDLIVIDTGDALLICDKKSTGDVKEALEAVKERGLALT